MRVRILLLFGFLAWLASLAVPSGTAGEKSKGLKVESELTADDPKDESSPPNLGVRGHHFKVHTFKMLAGHKYQIDMKSTEIDPFLRLEDPAGKMVAFNDDVAQNDLNSRIIYFAEKPGTYRIIATNFISKLRDAKTGKYTLTVVDLGKATAEEIQLSKVMKKIDDILKLSAEERKETVQTLAKIYA
ncbi:MAG TPA: hypothetical protein VKE98_10540, partial [Gemmataceae bacterium]|nr:hypothetical protein [Gemmataceae bacterium]